MLKEKLKHGFCANTIHLFPDSLNIKDISMGCLMLSSYFDEDKTKNKEVLEYQKNNVGPLMKYECGLLKSAESW